MTLNELKAEVYTLTNRPDLAAETLSAIKAATLKAHHSDFYSKDIYETSIEFEVAKPIQSLDYINLIPNYRALKYFRRVSDEFDTEGTFFTVLTPEEILDSYGVSKTNIIYVAGRALEIRSAVDLKYALIGCYVNPIITELKYSSWVAEMFPFAIVFEAARLVFKAIGADEKSASFERLTAEQFNLLKASALADVGF